MDTDAYERQRLLTKGIHLQYLSISLSIVEGCASVAAGVVAGSVELTGFGVDSFIETASAVLVCWRLKHELRSQKPKNAEVAERKTARIAGALMLALALYIAIDAGRCLFGFGPRAEKSKVGIAITILAATGMPILGFAKLRIAKALNSGALRVDAYESITCAWLAIATLAGLILNVVWHLWWADPIAGLLLLPLIVREGLEGLRGGCDCHDSQ